MRAKRLFKPAKKNAQPIDLEKIADYFTPVPKEKKKRHLPPRVPTGFASPKYNRQRQWKVPDAEKVVKGLRLCGGCLTDYLQRYCRGREKEKYLSRILLELDKPENSTFKKEWDEEIASYAKATLLLLEQSILSDTNKTKADTSKARIAELKLVMSTPKEKKKLGRPFAEDTEEYKMRKAEEAKLEAELDAG